MVIGDLNADFTRNRGEITSVMGKRLHNILQHFDYSVVNHAWHFRTRNCTFKMRQIFPKPRDNFGSLVANLRIVKLLKLRELILVRVFLEGYLRVIGRQMVSHGSK